MLVCQRCRSIYSVGTERCGIDGGAIVDQQDDPMIGHEFSRYQVTGVIGRGAMGSVYRARHSGIGRECALKVLYGNFALNQRLIERFQREAQTIGQMSHPNIVSVIDFDRTDAGLTYLVMELVDGQTLEEAIADNGSLNPNRTAHIARQIASALSEAHRHGFVHRDMKPANVMLTDPGILDIVKILDFGVVGLLQAAASAKLTQAGHIVGTPCYMAPEQARTSSVTPAADLYALGCIMYEMLSGRAPFEGQGISEVLLKQIHETPAPLRSAFGLEKLVMWLLEKEPASRPESAQRVIAEIEKLGLGATRTDQIVLTQIRRAAGKPVAPALSAPEAPQPDARLMAPSVTVPVDSMLETRTELDFRLRDEVPTKSIIPLTSSELIEHVHTEPPSFEDQSAILSVISSETLRASNLLDTPKVDPFAMTVPSQMSLPDEPPLPMQVPAATSMSAPLPASMSTVKASAPAVSRANNRKLILTFIVAALLAICGSFVALSVLN